MRFPYVSIDKKHGSAWSDDGIPCPYCGNVIVDDLQEIYGAYTEDGGELTCHNDECGKDFTFIACISYSYTARKIKPTQAEQTK